MAKTWHTDPERVVEEAKQREHRKEVTKQIAEVSIKRNLNRAPQKTSKPAKGKK